MPTRSTLRYYALGLLLVSGVLNAWAGSATFQPGEGQGRLWAAWAATVTMWLGLIFAAGVVVDLLMREDAKSAQQEQL